MDIADAQFQNRREQIDSLYKLLLIGDENQPPIVGAIRSLQDKVNELMIFKGIVARDKDSYVTINKLHDVVSNYINQHENKMVHGHDCGTAPGFTMEQINELHAFTSAMVRQMVTEELKSMFNEGRIHVNVSYY